MAFKMKGWSAGAGTGSASPMKQGMKTKITHPEEWKEKMDERKKQEGDPKTPGRVTEERKPVPRPRKPIGPGGVPPKDLEGGNPWEGKKFPSRKEDRKPNRTKDNPKSNPRHGEGSDKFPRGAKMSTPEQMKEATKDALKPEDAPWMKGKKSPMEQGKYSKHAIAGRKRREASEERKKVKKAEDYLKHKTIFGKDRKVAKSEGGEESPMKQGALRDPDYYKRGNFMDVEASKKAREAKEAYGPEGKPATVKPKEGRDAYSTAIPQSQIGKREKLMEKLDASDLKFAEGARDMTKRMGMIEHPRAKKGSSMKQGGYAVGSKIKKPSAMKQAGYASKIRKPSAMKQAGFIGARSPSERNFSQNQQRADNIRKAGDDTSDYNKQWAKAWEGGPDTRVKYDGDAGHKSYQRHVNKKTKNWAEAKTDKLGRKLTEEEFDYGKGQIKRGRKAY